MISTSTSIYFSQLSAKEASSPLNAFYQKNMEIYESCGLTVARPTEISSETSTGGVEPDNDDGDNKTDSRREVLSVTETTNFERFYLKKNDQGCRFIPGITKNPLLKTGDHTASIASDYIALSADPTPKSPAVQTLRFHRIKQIRPNENKKKRQQQKTTAEDEAETLPAPNKKTKKWIACLRQQNSSFTERVRFHHWQTFFFFFFFSFLLMQQTLFEMLIKIYPFPHHLRIGGVNSKTRGYRRDRCSRERPLGRNSRIKCDGYGAEALSRAPPTGCLHTAASTSCGNNPMQFWTVFQPFFVFCVCCACVRLPGSSSDRSGRASFSFFSFFSGAFRFSREWIGIKIIKLAWQVIHIKVYLKSAVWKWGRVRLTFYSLIRFGRPWLFLFTHTHTNSLNVWAISCAAGQRLSILAESLSARRKEGGKKVAKESTRSLSSSRSAPEVVNIWENPRRVGVLNIRAPNSSVRDSVRWIRAWLPVVSRYSTRRLQLLVSRV